MANKIAIVTGASSGMGQCFAKTASRYVQFDELWIIARRRDRLDALKSELVGQNVKCLDMDLTSPDSIDILKRNLSAQDGLQIVLLINAAGFGKFQAIEDIPVEIADNMLDLNCKALMNMCYACLPYMNKGSRILNIASVAAFQPVPYIAEYAATKAFVLSFSRSLWKELQPKGITVTALCPYWTSTEFFSVANNKNSTDRVKYFNAMYKPQDVVNRGWRDLLKGRDISTFGFIARAQIALVKLFPHRSVMSIWCSQQKIK